MRRPNPMKMVDAVLAGARPPGRSWAWRLAAMVAVCGGMYGLVMGSFAGFGGDRGWQVLASALKMPFLILATLSLSLPSFFVMNTLMGVRADFGEAIRAVLSSQAVLTIVLVSLAPVTALWYVSTSAYQAAILFNAAMFTVASLGAQIRLRAAYAPLIRRNPVHGRLLAFWLFLFALVGIQMGWLLRPFVGDPAQPFQLFRDNAWGNAYVIVARMVGQQVGLGR